MKIKINFECTPQEARELMGLPDMGPLWDKAFEDGTVIKSKLTSVIKNNVLSIIDPFNIMSRKSNKNPTEQP